MPSNVPLSAPPDLARRYRCLAEATSQMIWTTDPDGLVREDSPSWQAYTGQSWEQFQGDGWADALHPDDRPAALQAWRAAVASGTPFRHEYRVRSAGGNYGFFLARGLPVLLADGSPCEWVRNCIDITHSQALRRSEERYRTLVTTSHVVWTTDADGLVREDSPSWLSFTGQTWEQFQGRGWMQAVHPDDRERTLAVWRQAVTDRTLYEVEYRMRSIQGGYLDVAVRGAPVLEPDGSIREWVGICIDVTARKRMEHRLQESEARLRMLTENLPHLVWTCLAEGPCDYLSRRWLEYTGVPAAPQLGYGWLEQVHPDDRERLKAVWSAAVESGLVFEMEFRLRRSDGIFRWFLTRAIPLRDSAGAIVKWFGSCTDTQEQKEIREALLSSNQELARKIEENEAFVYMVSHDLRAPLVNLQGFARELELSCGDLQKTLSEADLPGALAGRVGEIVAEDIPASLKYIVASTSKFERLINSLLTLSRAGRQAYQPETLDVERLVHSTTDSLQHILQAKDACLTVGALPACCGDATAVGQVFGNLLYNALLYLDPHRPGRIQVGGERQGDFNHYWVQDNGVGIPESGQERLFQIFARFHPDMAEGEGVGLAVVKRVVTRHGGKVWAESQCGQGTTFHFTLPQAKNES